MQLVYITPEIALPPAYPLYAGGLGITAADFIKELGNTSEDIQTIVITLLYPNGYGAKNIGGGLYTPQLINLDRAFYTNGVPIDIEVKLAQTTLRASVWQYTQDKVLIYYLWCEQVSQETYPHDNKKRLEQELLLGKGAYMLCKQLGIEPNVYHINEPHCAFFLMEKEQNKDTVPVLFTSHSMQTEAYEDFHAADLSALLSEYSDIANSSLKDGMYFSTFDYCVKHATKVSAVSKFHAEWLTNRIQKSVDYVTSGIHIPSWDGIGNEDIILQAKHNKKRLIDHINEQYGAHWQETDLLIGWARGLTARKNPSEILDTFLTLSQFISYPVRLVISGNAHPGDEYGKRIKETLMTLSVMPDQNNIVYYPGYDTPTTTMMTQGCDIWLNIPKDDTETCGTSNMKAALNGTLPFATKEGWLKEININDIGFEISKTDKFINMVQVLKEKIIPLFYENKNEWCAYCAKARALIVNNYSTTEMVKKYNSLYKSMINTA